MNPFKTIWNLLKNGWDILRTVYWYNSLPWRILKSGALIVLGFFCLSGGNLLHSYKPHWDFLNYIIAYGFLLIVYGPIHHLLVIPLSLKGAHYSWGQTLRINKRGPFWTLIAFFVAVGFFGAYPLDVMTFEFSAPQLTQSHDIDPDVECYRKAQTDDPLIYCNVPVRDAIAYVEVENRGNVIETDREPPFELTVDASELEEVVGQKNFHIILRDKNDYMIRRYVRSATMVETKKAGDTEPDRP
ncbi:MAG: hypothetical protein ABEK50_16115 [bacterium]